MLSVTHVEIASILESADVAVDMGKIQPETSLREAGVDSLDMANVLLMIEEKYGIKIPDEHVKGLDSIDGIVMYLRRF
jgi:acyl carrier protein